MLEGRREVSGSDDSLLAMLAAEDLEEPELMDYIRWVSWRAGPGRRPSKRKGDPAGTTPADEAALWRSTMEHLYSADWRQALADRQAAAAMAGADGEEDEEEEESRGPSAVELLPASGAAGSSGVAGLDHWN